MMRCPLCDSPDLHPLFEVPDIPVFQNKVYPTAETARKAAVSTVSLSVCARCDYIFNSSFNEKMMNYDAQYQNEQACSPYFQRYLDDLITLLKDMGLAGKHVIEIGCGKGAFIQKLWQHGIPATGFDPAYEGDDQRIIKDYFSPKYSTLKADVIILRQTLEHIKNPLRFLHTIAEANGHHGLIFIEVPCFEWIIEQKAFWDIFYEHCNYFTGQSLTGMFNTAEFGRLFNSQYMYALADLSDLRKWAKEAVRPIKPTKIDFDKSVKEYKTHVTGLTNLVVWGAGAKGSAFLNQVDPQSEIISYVVDINPKKQNHYIPKTAHKIVSPEIMKNYTTGHVLIMNENYQAEIVREIKNPGLTILTLGKGIDWEKSSGFP
ncbi:MAG: methyltransferase domain-containing protein [Deltaproteobacteria bacterium]|nr:methyltransferase domain-containing protein [Deltaproteobacteria bacterium]